MARDYEGVGILCGELMMWNEWRGTMFAQNHTQGRRSIGHSYGNGPESPVAAKAALKYPPVVLNGHQARAVGEGFGENARKSRLPVWACAILPGHVHLVVGRPGMKIEQCVIQLKGSATERLLDQKLHPLGDIRDHRGRVPKCFAQGQWKVFLNPPDVPRAVGYVDYNPLKEGKPRQEWSFVESYRSAPQTPRRG